MALSTLQSVTLYTTILITLKLILTREIGRNGFDNVWDDPVWKNFTSAINTVNVLNNVTNSLQSSNLTLVNATLTQNSNSTSSHPSLFPPEKPFYLGFLPRNVFIYALLVPLQYYWNIGLECFFPTRPRGVEVAYEKEKKGNAPDIDEDRDEEVVKRWIAQGRVRRSSVSWCNTFLKWVLDMTVGKLWFEVVWHLVDGVVMWEGVSVTLGNLKKNILMCWISSFLSIGPFASLIGFIVIPAEQRVVFRAGIDLVEAVFFNLFLRLTVPWLVKTELVQTMLGNATEGMLKNSKEGEGKVRLIDEL